MVDEIIDLSLVNHYGFDELIDIISTGKPIHSASDGSVLSGGRTSAGLLFWRLAAKSDTNSDVEAEDIQHKVKVLFEGMILVNGTLEEMNSYRQEAMGMITNYHSNSTLRMNKCLSR